MTDQATLFAKLAKVMGEVGRVEKRGYNDFHKYKYVLEADLVEAVREKLSAAGVALIPAIVSYDERTYSTTNRNGELRESVVTTVRCTFTFVDGETGATFTSEWIGQGDDGADKGAYKAMTGALKYFLMKTFLIPTGDDPEGDSNADSNAAGRARSSPGRTAQGVTASPAQVKFVKSLITKSRASRKQLQAILERSGFDVKVESGWLEKLTGGKQGSASALIDALQNPLPDLEHPSDVDSDTSGFEPSPEELAEARQLADETFGGVGTA